MCRERVVLLFLYRVHTDNVKISSFEYETSAPHDSDYGGSGERIRNLSSSV